MYNNRKLNTEMQSTSTGKPVYGSISAVIMLLLAVGILLECAGSVSCSGEKLSATGEQTTMDILRNTLEYIRAHHPETASLISDGISFAENADAKGKQGYSRVVYTGGGWTISIGRAITPENIYDIRAEYGNGQIVWVGTSSSGVITEESYNNGLISHS
jgi:hypothetical protein